ncbi:MAG: OmcA/MtrC family decaheme c-type cytochrome [Deltaproteobacteria bacterium]|nr:OmcA/MtrC family decaheme c-type cytochrome [Deltaproteobacteria bacterium]
MISIGRRANLILGVLALWLPASIQLGCEGSTGPAGDPGTAGPTGVSTLVNTTVEPAGANCANGGTKVEVGPDANRNGTLDAAEIDAAATRYICSGTIGTPGLGSLVKTSAEPAGANCPTGGVKIETGVDANSSGVLDATEVNAALTTYACNGPTGISSSSSGLTLTVKSVSTTAPIAVRFTMKDSRGNPVDRNGVYSLNLPMSLRFSLSNHDKDANNNILPYNVLTASNSTSALTTFQPTTYSPDPSTSSTTRTPAQGTLVENGANAGDYTYTFPATDVAQTNAAGTANGVLYKAVTYDAAKMGLTHTVWIQTSRQTDLNNATSPAGFTAVNAEHNYIPSGVGTPTPREITLTANCNNCHRGFTAEGTTSAGFHGSGRIDANFCGVCHNPARTNQAAQAGTFVHRIHAARMIQPTNAFHNIVATYPQDVRNCDACHKGAAQGAQSYTRPNQAACGSCHDQVDFVGTSLPNCEHPPAMVPALTVTGTMSGAGATKVVTDSTKTWTANQFVGGLLTMTSGPNSGRVCNVVSNTATAATCARDFPNFISAGETYSLSARAEIAAACKHRLGPQPDTACAMCHTPSLTAVHHMPVTPPDPNNSLNGGTNANTNAAYLAASGFVPPGATVISYVVSSVTAVDDAAITPDKRPQIKFKFQESVNGAAPTDVIFQTYAAGTVTEMMPNFVGSPSAYFAFAVPQDGIRNPADFNVTGSGYIKTIWTQTAPTVGTMPMTRDANGFYTLTLTNVRIPPNATMLTGGIGYTYSLSSTIPLTQTNVNGFPYNPTTKQGGLIVPAHDAWKVATGYTGRRTVVDNNKCLTCHVSLGADPQFHAGQRNDAPTCSFCHNPNRTSSGWSANVKDFVHSIHGARKRTVDFNWHAAQPGLTFGEVEFPGPLNNCQACHVAGGYDFSLAANAAAIPNMLVSTAAQGFYKTNPIFNPTGWFSISPYVNGNNQVDYGFGFSTSNRTLTLPDGNSGTQGATVCTQAAPCVCTAANPCSVVSTTGKQGSTTCSVGAPCTCQTQSPNNPTTTTCSVTLATCSIGTPCQATDDTLVKSPITAACSACHDSSVALDHMRANGGQFYAPRATVLSVVTPKEQCLLCHGPGKLAAISEVHK